MANYSRALKEALRKAEYKFVRQGRGDHEIWESPKSGARFVIDGKIKSRHTANEVPQAGGIGKTVLVG
jgi:hypothetical protein